MNRGYIKLWRSSFDNDMYFSEPFTKWQAWTDLLLLANHKARKVDVRGILVSVESGSVLAGEEFLSSRWKWSRGKVRRFMSYLSSKSVQQIVQQKSNVCTVITIVGWERYQQNGTANSTTGGQQTVQQTDTPKNVNKEKNDKNKVAIAPELSSESSNPKPSPSAKADSPKTARIPPSLDEVLKWADKWAGDKGKPIKPVRHQAEKAWNHYERTDWVQRNGNKIKVWKTAISGNWFSDEQLAEYKPKKTVDLGDIIRKG